MTDDARTSLGTLVGLLHSSRALRAIELLRVGTFEEYEALMALTPGIVLGRAVATLGVSHDVVNRRLRRLAARMGGEEYFALDVLTQRGIVLSRDDFGELGLEDATTTVYRHFGAIGELLYVGIAAKYALRGRTYSHHSNSAWWPLVRSSMYEDYPNRRAAYAAELRAIRTEHPIYNVAGKRRAA